MEKVTHGKMNSRVRESFLSVEGNQKIRWVRGERKKGKKKKRKRKERKERRKKGKENEERKENEEKQKKERGKAVRGEEEKEKEKKKKGRNDTSLHDLWLTSCRNASGQETKLVHVTRATHGYQKLRVSSYSKR